jgi:hypothetical protein
MELLGEVTDELLAKCTQEERECIGELCEGLVERIGAAQ